MKNILVLIHDDAGQEARFQAALDVTRAVGGHLTCLDVSLKEIVPAPGLNGGGVAVVLESEVRSEAANKKRLEARLRAEDVAWDWVDSAGFLAPCLEQASLLSDLIVVNRRFDRFPGPDMGRAAAELVVNSRRPILAVPDFGTGFKATGAALVAWDGSREAATALHAATPLLRVAGSVTLVEIADGSIRIPAEEAATYLSRYDVHGRIVRVEPADGPASAILLAKANSEKFDYLVMGGFGHSRFREALLGGVTRRLLRESPIPLLLAH